MVILGTLSQTSFICVSGLIRYFAWRITGWIILAVFCWTEWPPTSCKWKSKIPAPWEMFTFYQFLKNQISAKKHNFRWKNLEMGLRDVQVWNFRQLFFVWYNFRHFFSLKNFLVKKFNFFLGPNFFPFELFCQSPYLPKCQIRLFWSEFSNFDAIL